MNLLELQQHRSEAFFVVDRNRKQLYSCQNFTASGPDHEIKDGELCQAICHKGYPCENCLIKTAFDSGKCASENRQVDGGIVNVRIWPITISEPTADFAVIFWQDVTSQKNLEAQLFHSQKLEAIGELAAGVAHEINNPLGYIYGNMRTMKEYSSVFSKLLTITEDIIKATPDKLAELQQQLAALDEKEDLADIHSDVENLINESLSGAVRVTEIVSNLKSFARPDSKEQRNYSVNEGLQSTLKILNNEIKYKCAVEEDYGEVPDIECYPGELNQVFVNIIANAVHSIEEHGTISIRTWAKDSEIFIEISDTGSGIDPSDLDHIFDPFFTTKPVGVGTGLGLSVSHGIIEKHKGRIMVKSTVGKGSVFTIVLPA